MSADPDTGKHEPGLRAIWIKRVHRGPMDSCQRGVIRAGQGLVGNSEQGGRRQITIVEVRRWEEMTRELGAEVDPSARRANLLVEGVDLRDSRGRVLRVGPCRIRIWGETRPCEVMEKACPGLQEAMKPDWRGGAYGEALDDGEIVVGDTVGWEPMASKEGS